MKNIIEPVSTSLIINELTKDKFVRHTNFANNEVYIIDAHNSPNIMNEIARLRELSFRSAGGGTGKELDIDYFDTMNDPYKQLIVWNPLDNEIIGGYRFIKLKDIKTKENESFETATSNMFHFTDKFIQDYLPQTIELGRSFVQPKYQTSNENRKGIFSLDNLWDGLGAIMVDNPDIKYFFGKVTLYLSFNQIARDAILYFMMRFFPDIENLVYPHSPKGFSNNVDQFSNLFISSNYEESHKKLVRFVREHNENIPPLVNAYMNLSPTMRTFGSALNHTFGDVEEIGIMVHIPDIYNSKKNRHINSYLNEKE